MPAVSGAHVSCEVCAVSAALRGWSSFCCVCLSFTCSCGTGCWSQFFGPSCCSCGLSSRGVSAAAFCPLGLLSHPLLLLFLAWVSSFGICSGWGWKAAVLSRILPSFGRGSPSLVLIFSLGCSNCLLSRLLEFLELFAGVSFLSLPVFADSSGWLTDSPWLSTLRCLAVGGVTLFFCQRPVCLP